MRDAINKLSKAARISQVLKEMMESIMDREVVLAYVRELEDGCRVFGISTEGKTLGRIKVELQAAIDKELGH